MDVKALKNEKNNTQNALSRRANQEFTQVNPFSLGIRS